MAGEYVTANAPAAALNYIRNNVTHLYLCSQSPTTFTAATVTYAVGVKATPTINVVETDGASGWKIVLAAFTGGDITAVATYTHWALTNNTGSELLLVGDATDVLTDTVDDTFSLAAAITAYRLPAPVAA